MQDINSCRVFYCQNVCKPARQGNCPAVSCSVLKLSFSVVGTVFEFRLSALCLQPFELVTDTLLFGLRILFFFGWSAAFPIALNWGLIRSTNGNAYTHYGEVKNLALPGSDEEGFISYKDLYNL